jgi:hypothetical protein
MNLHYKLQPVEVSEVVDRGARDAADVPSHLIDRRPLAGGGKEAARMLKIVGNEAAGEEG